MSESWSRRGFLTALAAAVSLSRCRRRGALPDAPGPYRPTWESIRTHPVPEWFDDAKLGIFIHWGLYSVPAWATAIGELGTFDWNVWFENNPYAEWYLNSLRIEGSPTEAHHRKTYGADFDYYDFATNFNERVVTWDPSAMASLFADVGARYVVLTTKHHDGFTLWPSEVRNPHLPKERSQASRDIVGDLTEAVRAAGMRMGLYYSGGLDWSFNPEPIDREGEVFSTILHTEEFARYADAHWRELIDRYEPAILWNDIGYPEPSDLVHIIADFYNRSPDGLINDRFESHLEGAPERHHDFVTPEYSRMDAITDYKWETCRGLGYSFGYNQLEGEEHTIGEAELIHLLADIVSKNGNLLLNVGPKANGSIPEIQERRLRALGAWLAANGEAIFGTHPWQRAEGVTAAGEGVRFTAKDGAVYAIVLADASQAEVTIRDLPVSGTARIRLLGVEGPLSHSTKAGDLTAALPRGFRAEHAYTLEIR